MQIGHLSFFFSCFLFEYDYPYVSVGLPSIMESRWADAS